MLSENVPKGGQNPSTTPWISFASSHITNSFFKVVNSPPSFSKAPQTRSQSTSLPPDVQCTLKTPADTCRAQTPWDWEWYPWSQSSNAVCQKPRLLPKSGNFKLKNVLLFEKKNLLLFENSELDEAGTNSDCRKFGRGGAIVWQKLRLRKISFQIFWR